MRLAGSVHLGVVREDSGVVASAAQARMTFGVIRPPRVIPLFFPHSVVAREVSIFDAKDSEIWVWFRSCHHSAIPWHSGERE